MWLTCLDKTTPMLFNSISFEQRTLKSRGDHDRKALWSEVLAEHMFSTLFSACASRCLFSSCTVYNWCSTVVHMTQPFGRRTKSPSAESFHSHPHTIMLSCVFWVARATLMHSMVLNNLLFDGNRVRSFQWHWLWGSNGAIVESIVVMDTHKEWSWLLPWMQNPWACTTPMVRVVDCSRSLVQFRVEVMVCLHDRIGQSDESSRTAVQHFEPNQNSNHNFYKKVSWHGCGAGWRHGSLSDPWYHRSAFGRQLYSSSGGTQGPMQHREQLLWRANSPKINNPRPKPRFCMWLLSRHRAISEPTPQLHKCQENLWVCRAKSNTSDRTRISWPPTPQTWRWRKTLSLKTQQHLKTQRKIAWFAKQKTRISRSAPTKVLFFSLFHFSFSFFHFFFECFFIFFEFSNFLKPFSKFGIDIPRVDDEDLKSSTESTISTSLIQCVASVGNCEQVQTSVLNLIFQQAKVARVGNLSKWRSEICSRCWSAP